MLNKSSTEIQTLTATYAVYRLGGSMTDQHVLSEAGQGIATITLNRPAALNALTPQMMDGLIDATARAERDSEIRCVVICGAGDHFMAGGDVKSFHKSLTEDRDNYLRRREMQVVSV